MINRARSVLLPTTLIAAVFVLPLLVMAGSFRMPVLIVVYLYGAVLVGGDLVVGFARQLTLAMPAFMAIGAYSSGVLTSEEGAPVLVGAAVGLAVSVVLALAIGTMALRVSGFGLVIITLLLTSILESILRGVEHLGGNFGVDRIPPVEVLGLDSSNQTHAGAMAFVLFVVCFAVARAFVDSGPGRELIATGQDAVAAAAVGINVARRRTQAFVVSAVMASLAGSLLAHARLYINPEQFSPIIAIELVLMLYLGGTGKLWAGVLGAALIESLPELGDTISDYRTVITGILFVVLLAFFRGGIYGLLSGAGRKVSAWTAIRDRLPSQIMGTELISPSPTPISPVAGSDESSRAGTRCDAVASGSGFLRVERVTKRFSGLTALNDVSFDLPAGGVVGLVGPNGAGKTTLFNVLAGTLKPEEGQIWLGPTDITSMRASVVSRLGVGRTFQTVRLWESLSVVDNVALGFGSSNKEGFWRSLTSERHLRDRAAARHALQRVGLDVSVDRGIEGLTLGERRLVEFARAAARGPQVVLLDEPASGLDTGQRDILGAAISEIARTRLVVLVEHDVAFVAGVADRLIVLDLGTIIFDGPTDQGLRDQQVLEAYLGQADPASESEFATPPTPPLT